MLNKFLSSQIKFNQNEKDRIDKINKKANNYENKKIRIIQKYDNDSSKKFYNKEILNTYEETVKEITLTKSINQHNDLNIDLNIDLNNIINNTIILSYQFNYNNNEKVTGFGDFIRGCYFLLQFSEKNNLKIDFCINNHPIKKYLVYFKNKADLNDDISCKINFFKLSNANYIKQRNIITYDYII